jgi:UDP-N-acetylglucosamine 2-epimerase (non-hydrolysing)|tara:strand:- start:17871 stop:18884 length:1014 start_codon:yes stop_codon:yes gene_type:complete
MVKDLLICFGTRPEWLKVKPVVEELDNVKLLFTGQHADLLKDIEVDYRIDIGDETNRLDQIISDCLLQFPEGDFDVMVHGDTVSAFACALAAFSRKLKIIHLEAGLRSYDLKQPYPEEGYRQMISRIADINFAPTSISAQNLFNEKTDGMTFTVGNSVLDNLLEYKDQCEYTDKVLVTLHRWENHHWMDQWFTELDKVAQKYSNIEFIIPLHHNPNVRKHKDLLKNVTIVPALPHNELLDIMSKSKFIISDSGGLQEEGAFLNKKVIVCRDVTERPEGLYTGHLTLCKTPSQLMEIVDKVNRDYIIKKDSPYGKGDTAKRVKQILYDNGNSQLLQKS